MPGFKGKRKRELTLTLYKKPFRYRLPVSLPRKRTKTSSSTPNLKSPSIGTPSLLKKSLSISKYLYPFKRVSTSGEFITRQTCKICDYTVDYMCRIKTSKSPHAFAMCSIGTDILKQENKKIDSL